MKDVVVISTHRSGIEFLDNLLSSFRGYGKYPILIVISDYIESDDVLFEPLQQTHRGLPIKWLRIETNSFEFGALYAAYHETDYDDFFLLSHSCEIVDTDILDIVFDQHRGKSVAGALQEADWNNTVGAHGENENSILKFLDAAKNEQMKRLGKVQFWQGHIGKYRRAILDQLDLDEYLPSNMMEAVAMSELMFTSTYHALDAGIVELFPGWRDGDEAVEKFGRKRLKLANRYLIKWKSHWNVNMVLDDLNAHDPAYKVRKAIRQKTLKIQRSFERLRKKRLD